jgi:thiosulfate/3-mercaptopyruvate sulfurtransferase
MAVTENATTAAPLSHRAEVLITANQLQELMADPATTPVILDVRWELPKTLEPFDGRHLYLGGHIPGAVYVDLDTELAEPPSLAAGRHPLPEPEKLQAAVRRWGVTEDRLTVVYDDISGMGAARAWWLLRDCGLPVRILDGGLKAWMESDGQLSQEDEVPQPSAIEITPRQTKTVNLTQVQELLADHKLLLDARAGQRYRGEVEPLDSRPGHIPGARSAPAGHNLDPDGRFLSDAQIRDRFEGHQLFPGNDDVAVYCGSGVTAIHQIAALAIIGIEAALYPGSYSQWSANPELPVATGPDPHPSAPSTLSDPSLSPAAPGA